METQVPETGARLTDLPPEVLGVICRSLRVEDRVALSITCRTLLHGLASSEDAWGTLKFRGCYSDGKELFALGWLAHRRQGLRRLKLQWFRSWAAAAHLAACLEGSPLVELKLWKLDLSREEECMELQRLGSCTALTGLSLKCGGLRCLPGVLEQLPSLADLSLANNSLGGGSWALLRQLTALTRLDVRNCGLTVLPAEVAALPALAALDLGGNGDMKAAEEEDWAPLAQCSSLISLGLGSIQFGQLPAAMAALAPHLVDLNLDEIYEWEARDSGTVARWDSVESALWPLFMLTALTRLNLSNCLWGDLVPEELSCLAALQDLDLSLGRQMSYSPYVLGRRLRALRHLTALTRLDLGASLLGDLPEEISHLQALADLDLGGNRRLRFEDLNWQHLYSLPALTRLSLRRCELESIPPGLTGLSSLAELDLTDNGRLGAQEGESSAGAAAKWAALEQLTALTRLDAQDCGLHAVPAELAALPGLRVLDLRWNRPLGRGGVEALRPFTRMTTLQRLELYGCDLPWELEVDAIPFPLHRLEGWAERIKGLSEEEIGKLRLG